MNLKLPMIGSVIYHGADLSDRPDLLHALVDAGRPAMGGPPGWYRCIYDGTDKPSHWRAFSASSFRELRTNLLRGVLIAIHFNQHRGDSEESVGLDLWIAKPIEGARPVAFPYSIKLVSPRDPGTVQDFVASCKAVWEIVESPYGLIYPGSDSADVYMELTSIPSRMLGENLTPEQEERLKWLGFWQRYEDELGQAVRTAYWGNLLGKNLVDGLGGLERVVHSAPAVIAEPLPHGGVYLQVSSTPQPGPANQRAREALALFLEPISVGARHPDEAPGATA